MRGSWGGGRGRGGGEGMAAQNGERDEYSVSPELTALRLRAREREREEEEARGAARARERQKVAETNAAAAYGGASVWRVCIAYVPALNVSLAVCACIVIVFFTCLVRQRPVRGVVCVGVHVCVCVCVCVHARLVCALLARVIYVKYFIHINLIP